MIYASSACVKAETIQESVCTLVEAGIRNIELSGGTNHYPGYQRDLLRLQDKHDLNYLVHNYFPPPSQHFVLNLASLSDELYDQSIEHCKRAIQISKILGSGKYGVHAGFLVDFSPEEAGNEIAYRALNNRQKAVSRFCGAWNILLDEASGDVELYIENNVLSKSNSATFGAKNPLLMTDLKGYLEIKEQIEFNLLLDLAHLKVSANSLGLSFGEQVNGLFPLSDYIHISGNNGLHDQNLGLTSDAEIMEILSQGDLPGKSFTLEVYDGVDSLISSVKAFENI